MKMKYEMKKNNDLEVENLMDRARAAEQISNIVDSPKESTKLKAEALGMYTLAAQRTVEEYKEVVSNGDIPVVDMDKKPAEIFRYAADLADDLDLDYVAKERKKDVVKWYAREWDYTASIFFMDKFDMFDTNPENIRSVCERGIEILGQKIRTLDENNDEHYGTVVMMNEQIDTLKEKLDDLEG